MQELTLRYPASALAGKSRLTLDDALTLRRWMFPSGLRTEDDALQLLAIHRSSADRCPQWSRWFVEAMVEYIINSSYPRRSLDAERADCLMAMIAPEGVIRDDDELELLLHALELAPVSADVLPALALDQLRLALDGGEGAYAAQRSVKRKGVSADDLAYVYRIVRDRLDRGRLTLTLREAEALGRIDAVTQGRMNHPGWRLLIDSVVVSDQAGAAANGWLRFETTEFDVLEEAA